MTDLIFVAIVVAFFGLSVLFVEACESILRPGQVRSESGRRLRLSTGRAKSMTSTNRRFRTTYEN